MARITNDRLEDLRDDFYDHKSIVFEDMIPELLSALESERKRVERLEKALKIYAHTDNWGIDSDGWVNWEGSMVEGAPFNGAHFTAKEALSETDVGE